MVVVRIYECEHSQGDHLQLSRYDKTYNKIGVKNNVNGVNSTILLSRDSVKDLINSLQTFINETESESL